VALESSQTLSSRQEETRNTVGDVLFYGYKWIKRLILPKTWTKIDVDPHHFDYSSLSSLFLCSLIDDSKVIYLIFFKKNTKINRYYYIIQIYSDIISCTVAIGIFSLLEIVV